MEIYHSLATTTLRDALAPLISNLKQVFDNDVAHLGYRQDPIHKDILQQLKLPKDLPQAGQLADVVTLLEALNMARFVYGEHSLIPSDEPTLQILHRSIFELIENAVYDIDPHYSLQDTSDRPQTNPNSDFPPSVIEFPKELYQPQPVENAQLTYQNYIELLAKTATEYNSLTPQDFGRLVRAVCREVDTQSISIRHPELKRIVSKQFQEALDYIDFSRTGGRDNAGRYNHFKAARDWLASSQQPIEEVFQQLKPPPRES